MIETIVKCPGGCMARMRDIIKRHAKKQGVFLRCEGNAVILKDCRRVSFVLEDREREEGEGLVAAESGAIELPLDMSGGGRLEEAARSGKEICF